jgi:hypothetical protein
LLEGASLNKAQLQGASLQLARIAATDFSFALLWRSRRSPPGGEPPRRFCSRFAGLAPGFTQRQNHSTVEQRGIQDLKKTIESAPPGYLRFRARRRTKSLDCANPDPTLASCNFSVAPPPEAAAWRKALEAASVDDDAYALALAKTLKELVCSGGDDDTIHIVRGEGFKRRL